MRSHDVTCAQRVGSECTCGAFEHNEAIYGHDPNGYTINAPTNPPVRTATPWVREAGGSLSILDDEGRHVAELRYEYWNGKQVIPWTEKEINDHGDLLVHCVNQHERLVAALRAMLAAYAKNAQKSVDEANGDENVLHSAVRDARAALANEPDSDGGL